MSEHPTATTVDIERRLGLPPGSLGATLLGLVAALPAGFSVQDAAGRLLFADRALADLFALPAEGLINGGFEPLLDPAGLEELRRAERSALGRSAAETSMHSIRIGGRPCRLAVIRQLVRPIDATAPPLLCSLWVELDDGRMAPGPSDRPGVDDGAGLESPALGDVSALGEAPVGQTLFEDQLRRELDLSSREHREFALVSIAIDRPDPAAAPRDEALRRQIQQTVDQMLRANIRTMDAAFRVADDRFVLILSGVGLATAHSRVEALRRQSADQRLGIGEEVHRFSVSIGVASYPHTARDRHEIVRAAATALDLAQRRGGNQVALASIPFDPR